MKNAVNSIQKMSQKTHGAVLYTRVSTGEQEKHGTSPESQRDACRAKALALSLPIVAEYHDGGISGGFLLTRAGMQAALADIQAGRADTLICPNISRYSRDVEHQQSIKKAVRAAGGRLIFCDMDFDDTAEGDLNFNIHGSFAEYERQSIKNRLTKGRWARAEQGQQPSRSRPPLGYKIISKAQVECGLFPAEMAGRYIIDEERAPLVQELFQRYASGDGGMPALCQDLNVRGVPTPGCSAIWRTATLRAILTNPVYKGQPAYGRTVTRTDESRLFETHRITGKPLTTPRYRHDAPKGRAVTLTAPALVSEAQWDAVQQRMVSNQTIIGGNPKRVRMLSGRVFCPCGHTGGLVTPKGHISPYYHCSHARNVKEWEGKTECSPAYYRLDTTERAVTAAFLAAGQNPGAISDARRLYAQKEAEQRIAERGGSLPSDQDVRRELADIDRALTELSGQEAAAVQAQIAGIQAGASAGAYAAVFADIAARRKDMEDRRGSLTRLLREAQEKKPVAAPDVSAQGNTGQDQPKQDKALQALADAALVLSAPDVPGETKRAIVGMVISRVVCQRDGADVYFLPGFAPFRDELFPHEFSEGEAGRGVEPTSDTLQTIEEFWYILAGTGRFHRLTPDGTQEEAAEIAPGDALLIPTGYRFWVENTGPADLVFLCLGTPPWPGPDEAIVWENL